MGCAEKDSESASRSRSRKEGPGDQQCAPGAPEGGMAVAYPALSPKMSKILSNSPQEHCGESLINHQLTHPRETAMSSTKALYKVQTSAGAGDVLSRKLAWKWAGSQPFQFLLFTCTFGPGETSSKILFFWRECATIFIKYLFNKKFLRTNSVQRAVHPGGRKPSHGEGYMHSGLEH